MSIFRKLSIVAVAGMFLLALAITASAQDEKKGVQFKGDMQTSFGQLSTESTGDAKAFVTGAELFLGYEANLYWTGGTGPLTASSRVRMRGVDATLWSTNTAGTAGAAGDPQSGTGSVGVKKRASGTNDPTIGENLGELSAWRYWVDYKVSDAFNIRVGKLNGYVDGVGSFYTDIDNGQQPIRSQGALTYGENGDGIGLTYKAGGGLTVGLGLGARCDFSCTGGLTSGTEYAQQTIEPIVGFKSGPLDIGFRYGMFSGTVVTGSAGANTAPTATVKANNTIASSMMYLGGSFNMGALSLALDYQTWTNNIKITGQSDRERTEIAFALRTQMGVEFMYNTDTAVTLKNATGERKEDRTIMQLQYMMKAGQGVWGPVFATEAVDFKDGSTTAKDDYKLTATTLGVVFKTSL